jgi:hemoglobin-like flavoprotein
MHPDERTLQTFEASLTRCEADSSFFDRFYDTFLASSPKVREKFAHTDFGRQKQALRDSLRTMLRAAADRDGNPARHLARLAGRHSSGDLKVGAALYDNWLDSLLATVRTADPEYTDEIGAAWEKVMMVGIRYMLLHY